MNQTLQATPPAAAAPAPAASQDKAPSPGAGAKARVLTASLLDIAVDLVLPTAAFLALAPTHLPVAVRLTMGGFLTAGKATTGRSGRSGRPAGKGRLFLSAAGAAAACAVTAAASFAGASPMTAIVAGTVVIAACCGLLVFADRRHLDSFAILVLAELAISVVLSLVSADARFILARPALYTAIAGIYVLGTLRGRPLMMEVTRPIASGGDPVRAAAFDRAWRESARFRAAERIMTALLGVVLLAEAVLRVVVVYSQPEGAVVRSSLLSQLPSVLLFAAWFAIARFAIVPVASREVDALMR